MRSTLVSLLVAGGVAAVAVGAWQHGLPEPSEAAAAVPSRSPQAIASVSLDGPGLPLQTLREVMTTRIGAVVELATLETDRAAVRAALVERGHWAAVVSPAAVTFGMHGAHVAFAVETGGAYRVRSVRIEGVSPSLAAELMPSLILAPGDALTPARLARTSSLLAAQLLRRNLGRSNVTTDVQLDEEALGLDVVLRVAKKASSTRP